MTSASRQPRPPRMFAAIVILLAAGFLYGGFQLIAVGGSFYYAAAGLALLTCGALLWIRKPLALRVYGLLLLATLMWSLIEAGADLWALEPRLGLLTLVGAWFLAPFVRRSLYSPRQPPAILGTKLARGIAAAVFATVVVVIVIGVYNPAHDLPARHANSRASSTPPSKDWRHYGNTTHGTRFAHADQINAANAGKLRELWHYRTGHPGQFKATPLQIGANLYFCSAMNIITALDAETGAKRWEFDPQLKVPPVGFNTTCRGVSFHAAPDGYRGDCPRKIFTGTTDRRLIALNAETGVRCQDFGVDGEVDLLTGIGSTKPNVYMVTSPPLIARNLIVVGTRIADNLEVNEPSGVIRAYDAVTGKFAWAWDMGRPGVNTEPGAGEQYTRGTPNVWSMMSYDDELGLIYAPTGNATPDFFGAHRTEADEKYSSSVVALDVDDGSVRWSFQTVHHDIWDYDVPSQPALIDLPQADGSVTPALVQATKRGELFLLDRRDGKPLAAVEEKPTPRGAVPEDRVAATQPFSVGMPQFRGPDLTEADMWGITPFDQMACRIQFRTLRYEGHFTPPSVQGTLQFPGNAGGFNWGSVAIDEDRQLLVVNPMLMASRIALVPRPEVDKATGRYLQLGTPYAATVRPFMSPLAVPCQKPPYGRLAVIDLQTRELLWNRRLGTTNESGPLGTKLGIALPMGVPLAAGTIVTRGGLIFFGGGQDRYFRAFDVMSGRELWRDYLPGNAQATPMSYIAPQSGKQIVVITVPNAQRRFGMEAPDDKTEEDPQGGHVIAYALGGITT